MGSFKLWLCCLMLILPATLCDDSFPSIQGCGGYIKSPFPIEFNQIEIKLLTKQGTLVMKTDCAPQTGYYFIPVERIGEYVLKIQPPEGWTFDPPEYRINFDKKNDECSRENDLNFEFKGFSVYGQVVTGSLSEGPAGVDVTLTGPHGLVLTGTTSAEGKYSFESIPPGTYAIKASHKDIDFDVNEHKFEITNKNIKLGNELKVKGYRVAGSILSNDKGISGVQVLLFGKEGKRPSNCMQTTSDTKGDNGEVLLCIQQSDSNGRFQFVGVQPGKYSVKPEYRGTTTKYDMNPEKLSFELQHESLSLQSAFQVEGFSVQGSVDPSVKDAKILVNNEMKATPDKDGVFVIPRMKPGKYQFRVESSAYAFQPLDIDISPTSSVVPKFVPVAVRVCGTIEGKATNLKDTYVVVTSGQSVVTKELVKDSNIVCVFLPKGSYGVRIESGAGKYYLPQEATVKITDTVGSGAFKFQQFQGSVGGIVKTTGTLPGGTIAKLYSSDGSLLDEKNLQQDTKNIYKFQFDGLESGAYTVLVNDNAQCWDNDGQVTATLKYSNVNDLVINQRGYKLSITTSHDVKVQLTQNNKLEQEVELSNRKEKTICLNQGTYKITPVGCHTFENPTYVIEAGNQQNLHLQAVKHEITGRVISQEKIEDLRARINGEYLDDRFLKGEEVNSSRTFVYKLVVVESPGNPVSIAFTSVGFSFEPTEVRLTSSDDCQPNAFEVIAKKAIIIKGKFVPPLADVSVRVELMGEAGQTTTIVSSNADGEYVAGPFIHSSGIQVTPSKPGYTFKPLSGDEYSFSVLQLAGIRVNVVAEPPEESLQNVLLSLSGPNAYRQNKYTDVYGSMAFTDLQAGQYYLKALLKEFRFEPTSQNIQLNEQETKTVTLIAKRESYSIFGRILSFIGDPVSNVHVTAEGQGECSEHGEDVSDEHGNFRIWALKPSCKYAVKLLPGSGNRIERTIPAELEVTIGQEHIRNVTFLAMTAVTRMDVSVRCVTPDAKYLDNLKAQVYLASTPDVPVHRINFNGYPYTLLPAIPRDEREYLITFESTLDDHQYSYTLPEPISFFAHESVAHFTINFDVKPASTDQDIGKSSYLAMMLVFLGILMSMNYDKVAKAFKAYQENQALVSAAKKTKSKTK